MQAILRRWRNRGFQLSDFRSNNGRQKKLSSRDITRLTSDVILQAHASMTLQERANAIRQLTGHSIHKSTVRRYYLSKNVKFKAVDVHSVNKLRKFEEIKRKQRDFATLLVRAKRKNNLIWYLDESSCSVWSCLRRKTWCHKKDNRVTLPY